MANTQQSAVDYIRNGRSVLLNGLQNLNLILHTLRQRKLLSDSEEDFVLGKDKTTINQIGRLLDLAANKGENVCYELLRILDITRYETFPMPVEQHPELHHWISCFPFANDPNIQTDDSAGSGPCSKYEKQLKMKATEILHEKWKQSMNVLKHKAKEKSFKYIPLVLNNDVSVMPHTKIKGYKKKNRTKKLKTYIPTDKRRLSPHDLLISKEKIILLVGKPGIGKTTVVQEILRIWAHGEHSQVSYMFYFDEPLIRFLSQSTKSEPLSCFLFNKYLKPEEDDDTVWKDIEENSENVVIIFDGIMNFVTGSVIEKIMKKEILNDAKILITCRPEADDAGDLSDWTSFRVEVQGFSETSIRAYFQWMLGINDKQMTNISALNNLQLLSLCHVPMYAFIVTACILLSPSEADYQPCTITELYVHIFLHCIALHRDRKMENLDEYIKDRKDNILFLASSSYKALMSKTVNLAEISKTDTVLHGFLTQVTLEGSSSSSQTAFVFLHNTMQEFWSALYLLMTPHEIGELLKQSQKEEGTYLKYVVIFLCGLLSQKTEASLKSLVIPDEIRLISTKYFQDIMNAFLYSGEEDDPNADVEVENVLYVCQCLYEYQTPEACRSFLQKVEYTLDLNDQPLDPHQCCALSYVISKSSSQTIQLNLMNCTIADTGIKLILGSLTNLKSLRLSSSSMQSQIWRVALQESETDFESLLRLFGFEMHLSEQDQRDMNMFHSASNIVLNGRRQNKVKLCLHLDTKKNVANSLLKNIYGSLHNIAEIRIITPDYPRRSSDAWNSAVDSFHLDLFLQGALYEMETRQMCVQQLLSINKHLCSRSPSEQSSFISTLYLHAKQMGILEKLKPVFQAWPTYWVLDLSQRNTFYLVELLKLQGVKQRVELLLSQEEYELKIFLQCLPYVAQVRFNDYIYIQEDDTKAAIKLLVDLFICASESGDDKSLKMLSTVCCYSTFPFAVDMGEIQSDFLLDLYSYVREYESQTGKSVLPALMPIYQTAPAVWVLDLSKGVTSLLHLTMQLQAVKKPVELLGTSNKTDLAHFLQCLPCVVQLRLEELLDRYGSCRQDAANVVLDLFRCAVEEGEATLRMLCSVCSYPTFPFADDAGESQSAFLLDLHSKVKAYEFQTGKSVLPALMPIYQTAPAVWVLDLSKGVMSLLHLTMQLQAVKKPVELRGWSYDTTSLKCFLQCLPFVSQLRFNYLSLILENNIRGAVKLLVELFILASEDGGEILKSLLLVCCYTTFPFADGTGEIQSGFLLDLYSYVREYESQTGKSVLPALMPIYQTAPAVWVLDLSKGVTSLLHLTMQLQSVKRPVELRGWSIDESELKNIVECAPHMSQLTMSDETMKQLVEIVSEAQDDNLTRSFLEKVGGDLSSSSLPWNKLQYLLQTSNIPLTLDSRKNRFATINMQDLLELLHRIHLSETNSQFVKNALKEIYASRAGHLVTSLLKTSGNWIHLSDQELDRYDCSALRFALHYSDDVRLDLSGATIPKEETKSILLLMPRVSHLRVDRHLLVELLHVCSVSREKRVATSLMMALQKKLDFSQPSAVGLLEQGSREPMVLSIKDCQSISSAIQLSDCDTDLIMLDCQAEDCALEQLFPALSHMRLRLDKPHLLQLILLTRCVEKADSWNRTKALSRALGKEIDLSHTSLDCHSCESLGLVLEHSEDLTHLNLSHCQLTDGCLELLLPHLHKVLLLDLSNNDITDHGAQRLQTVLTSTQTVRIFNNFITDMRLFIKNLHYQETLHNTPTCVQAEEENISKSLVTKDPECVFVAKAPFEILTKRITTVAMFDPDIYIHDDHIMYRFQCEIGGDFQCRSTQLIFGMKGSGFVEYKVINWDIHCFSKHSYKPAGPLYEIKTLKGEIYQLYLPHCETEADSLGDISVAHMHDGSMQILAPVNLTCTHVGVHINGLSSYGTVHRKGSMTRSVRGQVLLFLEQINKKEKRLWVFLLSRTVSHREIKRQQQGYTPIKTSSDCILTQKGKYCLTSNLKHCKVQPKTYTFQAAGDADHHAAFELFIGNEVSELQVKLQEKGKQLRTRWNRRVILNVNDNHANKIKTEEGAKMEENVLLTEKDWKTSLCNLLEDLSKKQLKKLRHLMTNTTNLVHIPRGKLEKKNKLDLIDIMIEAWGFQGSVYAVKDFMKRLPRNDDAVNCMLNPYLKQFGL
ncbi:uncharacterized protein LOC143474746 isoform X2 [Brachyhypopomus gauderio]|uniref:uncharacterized protein LOC143474746 isoform X2 n=1 Tax=Brachyhypopomus gauderio TaxID=698409 RepID=UPI0040428650